MKISRELAKVIQEVILIRDDLVKVCEVIAVTERQRKDLISIKERLFDVTAPYKAQAVWEIVDIKSSEPIK